MKKIGVTHIGNDAFGRTGRSKGLNQTPVAPLRLVVTVPVFAELVAGGGIHCRHKLKRVQRFTSGVDLLEDNAYRFL